MPEEVLFEVEQHKSRADIAAVLRSVAENLESGGAITVGAGENSVTVDPPETSEFEIKVEREWSKSKGRDNAELSIEFELEWDENQEGSGGAGGDLFVE